MSLAGVKQHFVSWRQWELNPIVVKELRQAVRSWAVTGMLLLFLAVLFITSLIFLVQQTYISESNTGLGAEMYQAFMVIVTVACAFFIPLYVGARVALERQDNNPDLFYVSTLSPGRIIRGKFFCGSYMALVFFSACMPFMAFTNLLRGVDLPTVFFALFCLFLVVSVTTMMAIFLACWPVSRPFKVLIGIYGMVQSIFIIFPMLRLGYDFMHSGIGARMGEREFWLNALTFIGVVAVIIGFFYVLAVALISPPSSNRALPVRVYMTAVWIFGGLLAWGWAVKNSESDCLFFWFYPTFFGMLMALVVVVSNSDHLSLRVRRNIPAWPPFRGLAFLFFNGAAGGLLWVGGILAATLLVTELISRQLKTSMFSPRPEFLGFWAVVVYAFDYCLCAVFIHRKFFPKRPPKLTGLIATLLAAAAAIGPGAVMFFLNRLTWRTLESLQLGNIFNAFSVNDAADRLEHFEFAMGLLAVMLLLNVRWFIRQWKAFAPPPPAPPYLG